MATHSSVLAWRIPGMVEPGGLPSMGSHRVGHDWSDLAAAAAAAAVHKNVQNNLKVQFWNRFINLLPKSWLCTDAKQKYRDGYGEGKSGFITLLGKGGTQYASASRTVPPSLVSRERLNSQGWHAKSLQSCLIFATLWTVACQAPLFMRFSRQEYWSGLPCPPPRNLPRFLMSPALDSLPLVPPK